MSLRSTKCHLCFISTRRSSSAFFTFTNITRGHGRVQGGRGRGGDGRGFNGNQKYPHAPAGDFHATQHIVQPPPGPPPTTVKPIQSTIDVISPAIAKVEGAVPRETVEDQHECVFGYSGGGGPGGFRGRGRGRGRGPSRGGYQGSESDMGGRGAPDASASGDLVGHMGRGRGGFRGRGYVSEGASTTEKIPTAGPPASRNKVWVREVDMESSLVAGR